MSRFDILFLLALALGGIVMYRIKAGFQAWLWGNVQEAPGWLLVLSIGSLAVGLVLVAAGLVPLEIVTISLLSLIAIAGIWGWLRYRRSPRLRRWQATWNQVTQHLSSDEPAAADRLITAGLSQDDKEREQLRAAALHDKRAATEFQRRTKAELEAWNRTAELYARTAEKQTDTSPGAAVFAARRQRLEADLDWIRAVLSGSLGAA